MNTPSEAKPIPILICLQWLFGYEICEIISWICLFVHCIQENICIYLQVYLYVLQLVQRRKQNIYIAPFWMTL